MKANEKKVELNKRKLQTCKICYGVASGNHYGISSCHACKVK